MIRSGLSPPLHVLLFFVGDNTFRLLHILFCFPMTATTEIYNEPFGIVSSESLPWDELQAKPFAYEGFSASLPAAVLLFKNAGRSTNAVYKFGGAILRVTVDGKDLLFQTSASVATVKCPIKNLYSSKSTLFMVKSNGTAGAKAGTSLSLACPLRVLAIYLLPWQSHFHLIYDDFLALTLIHRPISLCKPAFPLLFSSQPQTLFRLLHWPIFVLPPHYSQMNMVFTTHFVCRGLSMPQRIPLPVCLAAVLVLAPVVFPCSVSQLLFHFYSPCLIVDM